MSDLKIYGTATKDSSAHGKIVIRDTSYTPSFQAQCALSHRMTFEMAYEKSKKKLAEYNARYGHDEKMPDKELLKLQIKESITILSRKSPANNPNSNLNPLIEIFGNLGKFKATIKHAYKLQGYEKTKHILEESLNLIEEISSEDRKKQQAISVANLAMAKSLLKISKDTGIDMLNECPNEDIKRAYKCLLSADIESKKPIASTRFYKLNGEIWDGTGAPPRSFKVWAKENNEADFEKLLVA